MATENQKENRLFAPNVNYIQLALNKYRKDLEAGRLPPTTILGQTVRNILEKLVGEQPNGVGITQQEAAETILKGLSK